ncbi:MAG TPA: metalloregulator ArsR/SmtB family transcription factor [Acidimicrobiales bacterium]|jgi:DNA-binding transcriptional ArsR family regulator|nr:metalloregulator ArsR/SmtB family transcription factor [Acidimicrobiales bacterium]
MKDAISEVFAALADDTRRHIYEQLLASANGRTATELSESANVSRQAIVKHLQVLERSGLAEPMRDGREVRYSAAAEGTERASKWLTDHAAAWDRRIAALEERARRGRTS